MAVISKDAVYDGYWWRCEDCNISVSGYSRPLCPDCKKPMKEDK